MSKTEVLVMNWDKLLVMVAKTLPRLVKFGLKILLSTTEVFFRLAIMPQTFIITSF